MTSAKKKAPWDRKRPAGKTKTRLTAAQKKTARSRAKKAGRRYPNLVDNMAVSRKAAAGKRKGSSRK